MDDQRINKLADKWLKGTITDPELKELENWFDQDDAAPLEVSTDADENSLQYRLYSKIAERGNLQSAKRKSVKRLWPRIAAAASIIAVLSFGGYFLLRKPQPQQTAQVLDIKPGGNKAVLTLAGGKKIILTNSANGTIATEGGTTITKTDSGKIQYASNTKSREVTMNTLETPRGGTYYLELSDGTKVWLNAASKLSYPSAFTGGERDVTLTGEAVFEVKSNISMPFHVNAAGHTFRDIGTEFDINAYGDEPNLKATLVEGSMSADNKVLIPGEQAQISGTSLRLIRNVDTDEITAWKNGYFQFNDENMESVMRKVSRWYDVEIEFKDEKLKAQLFTWRVSRYKTITPLLRKLELTGAAHFTIENKKIIIHH